MQEHQREKAELIGVLNANRGSEACQKMVKFLDFMIKDVREVNDSADESEFKFNQGKIAAFKILKDAILNGTPIK